jgi:hypothetical protein
MLPVLVLPYSHANRNAMANVFGREHRRQSESDAGVEFERAVESRALSSRRR